MHVLHNKHQLPVLTPSYLLAHTHAHTHSLSWFSPHSTSCLSPFIPLLRRLMQWLIVWEVPLSSLAGLEALVRGHIRSFLWIPLCLASHEDTQCGGQPHTSYWRNISVEVKGCLREAGIGHFTTHLSLPMTHLHVLIRWHTLFYISCTNLSSTAAWSVALCFKLWRRTCPSSVRFQGLRSQLSSDSYIFMVK